MSNINLGQAKLLIGGKSDAYDALERNGYKLPERNSKFLTDEVM